MNGLGTRGQGEGTASAKAQRVCVCGIAEELKALQV